MDHSRFAKVGCHVRSGILLLILVAGCHAPVYVSPESPLGRARAYLADERYADARDAYVALTLLTPGDPRVALGLGAAYEGLDQLDSAQAVYDSLGHESLPRSVRRQIEGRVQLVTRRRWREAAHEALANEARLTTRPPAPNTIAVFPVLYMGGDSTLRPLQRALAQFIVADLAQVEGLRLLEREQVQFLLDEMALTDQGAVDLATGALSGRLLRAERVVQGSLIEAVGTEELRLEGDAVQTATAEIAGSASAQDRLDRLFDMEKAVVLQLLDEMGVVTTPAERERIAERPTASLSAFLAFGQGLELEDQDAYRGAQAAYERASAADPGFGMAKDRAEAAASMAAAEELSLTEVAGLMDQADNDLAFLTDNLNFVMGSGMQIGDRIQDPRGQGPPGGRDGVGEVGGEDRLGGVADLPITVRRP